MPTCLNHPDSSITRPCAVCEDRFCLACLEPFPEIGAVCASCEKALDALPPAQRRQQLPQLRLAQQKAVVPEVRFGRELAYWTVVLLPSLLTAVIISRALQMHSLLEVLAEQPLLPLQVQGRLLAVATGLEQARLTTGHYPRALTELTGLASDTLLDPYSGTLLQYQVSSSGYRLCSLGPDRVDSSGKVLEHFATFGDLCVRSSPSLR